jgi:DNA-binding NarL/FixJ family response regulator
LIDGEFDMEIVAEANDLTSLEREVSDRPADVLILDLEVPGGLSMEAIDNCRRRAPATQIVAATMHDNPAFAQRALAAGALGFVMKERADEELPAAVRAAARGEATNCSAEARPSLSVDGRRWAGRHALTKVPRSSELTLSVPPARVTRSCIPIRPKPLRGVVVAKPDPLSCTSITRSPQDSLTETRTSVA